MAKSTTENYRVEIFNDSTYTEGSSDNVNQYDYVYFNQSKYYYPSVFGIKVFQGDIQIKSAIIGAASGATAIHDTSVIIESDRLLVCCSDTVFCLSIPNLLLLWQTKADEATCFEIFKYQDSYIVHGELEISRLDKHGKIIWKQGGADIFTTPHSGNDFAITDDYILAIDWDNRQYKFDFDGQIIP